MTVIKNKNPLGRYKVERKINLHIVKLDLVGDKVKFQAKWPWETDFQHSSGLFNTPKEALLVAKEFCR